MILSDLPELLPLLEINRAQNTSSVSGVVEVQQLTWGNTQQIQAVKTPDVILLADCIYYGEVSATWTLDTLQKVPLAFMRSRTEIWGMPL